jgi:hypothetical protein
MSVNLAINEDDDLYTQRETIYNRILFQSETEPELKQEVDKSLNETQIEYA